MDRHACAALDAADPLAPLRDLFDLPPGLIYLDGNSLGPLPRATPARLERVAREEWGRGLIASWNTAGWMASPGAVGDLIAPLIGAAPKQVIAADSTSVNLHKTLGALLDLAPAGRRVILSERDNFPSDLYVAQGIAAARGLRLVPCDTAEITARLCDDVAVLMLTHVNYRTGAMHDMAAVTAAAHAVGALMLWDLAHSAGAVPVDLLAAGADAAISCGYKYLNGGPGAPAFLWLHPRHAARAMPTIWGWLGHARPFEFSPHYAPAEGAARFVCGTPGVLGMAALEEGVRTLHAAEPFGGMAAIRRKSLAQTRLFMDLVRGRCGGHSLAIVTPEADARRGSQVCLSRASGAYEIMQALIARGIVGDFRAPDILRFGFTPLYTGFVDVWDAVEALRDVLETGAWEDPRFARRAFVT